METIEVENNKYKLIKDYRDGFDKDLFLEKYTSFFEGYDYIVGDIAYSKLRLKGFTKKENKLNNKINDYCRYFILEKIKENNSK